MLALAQALRARGHEAAIACPATFGDWVRSYGVEHHALGEDLQALIAAGPGAPGQSLGAMTKYFTEQMAIQGPRLLALSAGADAIVGTGMAWMAPSVGEKLGIFAIELLPSTSALASADRPPTLIPFFGLPRWLNRVLWWLSDQGQDRLMGAALNGARASIGLPAIRSFSEHLFVDTPCVIAADEGILASDPSWNGRYPYSGFLFLDDPSPLDPELNAWIERGEPPIYVGFGSMAGASPERVGQLLSQALEGKRCLVSGATAKLFDGRAPSDSFMAVGSAPHQHLFPKMAVVVHHGGAGTMASALRAGVPQVVLPMLLDQFLHAHVLAELGLAPKTTTMAKVTASSLRNAIDEALAWPAAPRQSVAQRLQASSAGAVIVSMLERARAERKKSGELVRGRDV
jgi:UDP:flavonoid glycosyltransferase YjiC (YdhE family)